jgi:hypothetical protein
MGENSMTSPASIQNDSDDHEFSETGSTMTSYEDAASFKRSQPVYRLRGLPYIAMIATMIPFPNANAIYGERRRYETETVNSLIVFFDEEMEDLESETIFPIWPNRHFIAFSPDLPLRLLPPRKPFIF